MPFATVLPSAVSAEDAPVLPRGLIFLSSLWLVGSWLAAIGVSPPVQPSSASYTPGVRLLLDCIVVGLIFGWPLLRLSQARCSWSIQRTALDVVVIAALVQIVVWPLRLVTPWSVTRMLAIDGVLVGWTALLGALLAVGGALPPRGRTLTMVACAALGFAGPLAGMMAGWLGANELLVTRLGLLSPFSMLRHLTGAGPGAIDRDDLILAGTGAAAAAVAWVAVFAAHLLAIRPDAAHRPPPRGKPGAGLAGSEPLSSSPHA